MYICVKTHRIMETKARQSALIELWKQKQDNQQLNQQCAGRS